MPRQIHSQMPLEAIEEEILFTQAALESDEDARDLAPLAAGWVGRLDEVRSTDRELRQAAMRTTARRVIANGRLDDACSRFADELWLDTGKSSDSPRWSRYFQRSASQLIRQALGKQVAVVRGWLSGPGDAVLEKHRAELSKWVDAADAAVVETRAMTVRRGELWLGRETLAEDLTRERDGVHEALSARARERRLRRVWPDRFFRVGDGRTASKATTPPGAEGAGE
ncbi:MAG: hypothetical protein HYV63_31855 [Candidatus Schekmanbacteria bacterium]|nr:hypothetical protein [Candidatus Schekmanbacteria bacterium]